MTRAKRARRTPKAAESQTATKHATLGTALLMGACGTQIRKARRGARGPRSG
jgi:hypothetical protein